MTSEQLCKEDNKIIEECFGIEPINEYGMAETGAIAYQKDRQSEFFVNWYTNLMQKSGQDIVLSNLSRGGFPFIRYKIDDQINGYKDSNKSILTFRNLNGRRNDSLIIEQNKRQIEVHSESIMHIMKANKQIIDFSLVQHADREITLIYEGLISPDQLKEYIAGELEKIVGMGVKLCWRDLRNSSREIIKTVAGKSKYIQSEVP